jgi:hypothetical protein
LSPRSSRLAERLRREPVDLVRGHVAGRLLLLLPHQAGRAEPWTRRPQDPIEALRSGIDAGATLWQANAGVPPFDDRETLVDTLVHAWTGMLYAY